MVNKRRKIFLLTLCLLITGGFISGSLFQKKNDRPNVILITVDTLRLDHLGVYGSKKGLSPNIDKLAKDAVVFYDAITPIPLTTPAHVSLFTSLYPRDNRVIFNDRTAKSIRDPFLAQVLRNEGYATAGFVSAVYVDRSHGLGRGFDFFDDKFGSRLVNPEDLTQDDKIVEEKNGLNMERQFERGIKLDIIDADKSKLSRPRRIINSSRTADKTIAKVINWLSRYKNTRFFVWVHLYDPHVPYGPPKKMVKKPYTNAQLKKINKLLRTTNGFMEDVSEFTKEDADLVQHLYDAEVKFADQELGKLMAHLKKEGLYNKSVIILLADHGEMLGEKSNYYGHFHFLYDNSVKIPFMIKFPEIKPKKIEEMARLIDVLPTLLAYLNIDDTKNRGSLINLPVQRRGENLIPMITKGEPGPGFSYIETNSSMKDGHMVGARTADWKYWDWHLQTVKHSYLVNLKLDPDEKINVIKNKPRLAQEFGQVVERYNVIMDIPDALKYRESHRSSQHREFSKKRREQEKNKKRDLQPQQRLKKKSDSNKHIKKQKKKSAPYEETDESKKELLRQLKSLGYM